MEAERARQQCHLTDEQFTELLLGAKPAAVREHLETCPQCLAEAERVSAAIVSFEQESRLWAERRASAGPAMEWRRDQRPAPWWLVRPQAWTAAALVLGLAAGVGVTVHRDRVRAEQQKMAAVETAPEVSPATLKADNELLAAIDGELRADGSTPAGLYGLSRASRSTPAKAAKRIANE